METNDKHTTTIEKESDTIQRQIDSHLSTRGCSNLDLNAPQIQCRTDTGGNRTDSFPTIEIESFRLYTYCIAFSDDNEHTNENEQGGGYYNIGMEMRFLLTKLVFDAVVPHPLVTMPEVKAEECSMLWEYHDPVMKGCSFEGAVQDGRDNFDFDEDEGV